jgi:hypothetical protein
MPPKAKGDGKKQVSLGSLFAKQEKAHAGEDVSDQPLAVVEPPEKKPVGRPKKQAQPEWLEDMPEHKLEKRERLADKAQARSEFLKRKAELMDLEVVKKSRASESLGKEKTEDEKLKDLQIEAEVLKTKAECLDLFGKVQQLGAAEKGDLDDLLCQRRQRNSGGTPSSSHEITSPQQSHEESPHTPETRPEGGRRTPGEEGPQLTDDENYDYETPSKEMQAQIGRECGSLGGQFGYLGSRPRKDPLVLRGTSNPLGFQTSNVRMPGADKAKREKETLSVQVQWLDWFHGVVDKKCGGDSEDPQLWKWLASQCVDGDKRFRTWLANEESTRQALQDLKLGKQSKKGVGMGPQGDRTSQGQRKSLSEGLRAAGGGQTNWLMNITLAVGQWVNVERRKGNFIDHGDLWLEFEVRVRNQIAILREKKEAQQGKLSRSDFRTLEVAEQCIESCCVSEKWQKNREYRINEIKRFNVLRLLKPQRLLSLSLQEEARRAQCTWMCIDSRMWVVAFGGPEELELWVSDAQKFIANREDTVISFSDQVPFNAKVSSGKQVYAEWERRRKSEHCDASQLISSTNQLSQKAKMIANELDDAEGMFQTRGADHAGASYFRLTMELCPKIYGWFKGDGSKPFTKLGKSLVVLVGTHARASNISRSARPEDPSDRVFLQDETFLDGDTPVRRKAGDKVGSLMRAVCNIRDFVPEAAKFFEVLEVMQQPAGFADAKICCWRIESQAEEDIQSLVQRDLFTGALTEEAKEAMRVSQSIPCWVAGKMTAAIQLVDTDLAHRLKQFSRGAQDRMRRELRAKAEAEGTPVVYKCGLYEILRICYESHMELSEYCDATEVILRGARRNCHLSRRPDYQQGKLLPLEDPWAVDYPEGSHRIKASWHEHRLEWVDENGKPLEPQWKKGPQTQGFEDQCEDQYHGPAGAKVELKSWSELTDDQKKAWGPHEGKLAVEEPQALLEFDEYDPQHLSAAAACMRAADMAEIKHAQLHPRADPLSDKRLVHQSFDPNLTSQRPSAKAKARAKALVGQKMELATRSLRRENKRKLDEAVAKYGRRKTLAAIVPGLSTSTMSKKVIANRLKAEKAKSSLGQKLSAHALRKLQAGYERNPSEKLVRVAMFFSFLEVLGGSGTAPDTTENRKHVRQLLVSQLRSVVFWMPWRGFGKAQAPRNFRENMGSVRKQETSPLLFFMLCSPFAVLSRLRRTRLSTLQERLKRRLKRRLQERPQRRVRP